MNNKKIISIVLMITVAMILVVGCSTTKVEGESKEEVKNEEVTINETSEEVPMEFSEGKYLVDKKWVEKNIAAEDLLILDARGEKAYAKGHIPNAIPIAWQSLSKMDGAPGDKGWGTVKDKEALAKVLSAHGIDHKKKIVVYTDVLNGWGEDGRIFWTLKMAGLTNVRILDGGINYWISMDGEVSKDTITPKVSSLTIEKLDFDRTIALKEIKASQDTIKIVDTREKDEFDGAQNYGEKRGGHLPNAIHFNFRQVLKEDGRFKSKSVLKELFSNAGLEMEDSIATYCTAGIRSAHLQVALEMVGYEKAMNYDGSFYEWAGNDECSVEK